ncbi:MBL fold metallo-hydrolase [Clostridium acetireducens]|uniref:MBL fold metallo-hydrolase n=1 Tax=Clostridium acetireducens TaxID=76489 RepID=UPI0008727D21|nr:MBL fold metallo-hydrolase [Clostridium acetireducens]
MNLKITTLIENNPSINSKLHNEHGLSLYIEIDKTKILFDTGQSGDFIENAQLLKVDLSKLNYVLLSHGHYDHSGGFRKFVDKFKKPYKLILGKGFFNSKYKTTKEGNYKYIGNAFDEEFVNQNNIPIKYIEEDVAYITKDIMIFSNFEKYNDFESISKIFKIKQNDNYIPDNFHDEIVLGVKSDKGLIIILGCSHIGIVNILETIMERTNMPIYAVVGGTHLVGCDELRLNNTIKFLKEKHIKVLGLSHCTGENAMEEIKEQFGKKFVYNNTGNIIKI